MSADPGPLLCIFQSDMTSIDAGYGMHGREMGAQEGTWAQSEPGELALGGNAAQISGKQFDRSQLAGNRQDITGRV